MVWVGLSVSKQDIQTIHKSANIVEGFIEAFLYISVSSRRMGCVMFDKLLSESGVQSPRNIRAMTQGHNIICG